MRDKGQIWESGKENDSVRGRYKRVEKRMTDNERARADMRGRGQI